MVAERIKVTIRTMVVVSKPTVVTMIGLKVTITKLTIMVVIRQTIK
jgi:hypothetical protein